MNIELERQKELNQNLLKRIVELEKNQDHIINALESGARAIDIIINKIEKKR